jgi:hypothetical protein
MCSVSSTLNINNTFKDYEDDDEHYLVCLSFGSDSDEEKNTATVPPRHQQRKSSSSSVKSLKCDKIYDEIMELLKPFQQKLWLLPNR